MEITNVLKLKEAHRCNPEIATGRSSLTTICLVTILSYNRAGKKKKRPVCTLATFSASPIV